MFRQLANGRTPFTGAIHHTLSTRKSPPTFHRTNYFNKELFQQKQKTDRKAPKGNADWL